MSEIVVQLTLSNEIDQFLAERGFISAETVHSCIVNRAIVDTCIAHLRLPADLIAKLNLKQTAKIDARTKEGVQTLNVYEGLRIDVEGREGAYRCLELPIGQALVLGWIPLQDLGLEPDLQNQRLRHLPNKGKGTYLRV